MAELLFLRVLNLSFTAGVAILFVLVARLLLKRAPKAYSYALWAVVLFRLLCPFSFESVLSLLPTNPEPVPSGILYAAAPRVNTGLPAFDNAVSAALPAATPMASANPIQLWVWLGADIWGAGAAALLLHSLLALYRLHRRLRGARHDRENIWYSDRVDTAFVLGIFRPRIILPAGLPEREAGYILLHEQTHIRRLDHLVKLASFLALCVHWFNPLVWLAFFLSARDMEMACDEAVIKRLGGGVKKEYSASLLALATGRRIIGGTPLAFGEGDTKGRVKNVLHYKKPAFWIIAAAAALVAVVAAGLAANPQNPPSSMNTIYNEQLTPERQSELAALYQLDEDSRVFESKFHVSDDLKSYAYYVERYHRGALLDVCVQLYGNLHAREGSMVTAFSLNRGDSGRWETMRWKASIIGNGTADYPAIPFPDGFVPQGFSTATLTNSGKSGELPVLLPDQPVILASISFHTAEKNEISAYSCTYLMEHPEKIAEYECVYLVKCVFSQMEEEALAQSLSQAASMGGYPTTFELYNDRGEILQSSYSLARQTATELPALLLSGTNEAAPSANGVPQNAREYLKITIGEETDRVYFVYASEDRFWVEKPFDYKYELERDTYEALMAYLAKAPSGRP